ncbi:MAG: hypothetical protein KDK91_22545, partial [Gammaproteobacteria bacterium]|nr:hypothetical protein [Gammaproteobacteria bacterium]
MSEHGVSRPWAGLWREAFSSRHIGPDQAETHAMLDALGYPTLDAFIEATVPASIRSERGLALPAPFADGLEERQALARLAGYAALNADAISLIGMGYHGTELPPVIARNVLENPGWYTAYTPYQP